MLTGQGHEGATADAAREALDGKDAGELRGIVGDDPLIFGLLEAVGPAETAMPRLQALDISGLAGQQIARLAETIAGIRAVEPDLSLTVDPGEYRGFEYQTGIAFSVFAPGVRGEIGRGGRYVSETGEPAVGATVYLDSVLRALPVTVSAAPGLSAVRSPPTLALPRTGQSGGCRSGAGSRSRGRGTKSWLHRDLAQDRGQGHLRRIPPENASGGSRHDQCRGGGRPVG